MTLSKPTARAMADELITSRGGSDLIEEEKEPRSEVRGWPLFSLRILVILVILGVWELAGRFWVDPFWISRPSSIAARFWEWSKSGYLWSNTLVTVEAGALGLLLGVAAGVILGFVFGRIRLLGAVLDPVIMATYSLPKVALAPLFILWFGLGMSSKVYLSAIGVFFLMFFDTFAGVREVDQDLVDLSRIMGASRFSILRKVVLPSSMVWIFLGLKVSIPYALIGVVVAEIVASNQGLGYLVEYSAGQFDSTGTFVALAVLMLLATLINALVGLAETRILRWKPKEG